MRLAVLALLALNVVVLAAGLRGGFATRTPGGESVELAVETQAAGAQLRLLRESSPSLAAIAVAQAPPVSKPAEVVTTTPPTASAPPLAPIPPPVPPAVRAVPEVAAARPLPADPATDITSPPLPVPATPAPSAPAAAPPSPQPALRKPSVASGSQALQCVLIGPASADGGRSVRSLDALLAAAGGKQITTVERRDGPLRHWVVMPGFASTGAAIEVLDRLTAAGITDTAILPDDDATYMISLGVFAQEAGARRHAERLRGAGFEAVMRPRPTGPARQWVRGEVPATSMDGLRLPPGVRMTPCAPGSG